MRRDAPSPLRAAAKAAAIAAAAALLASGCAAPIKVEDSVDALALLSPGAVVYARMGAAQARDLVPSLVPAPQAAALDPLLGRTRCLALGLGRAAASSSPGGAGIGTAAPADGGAGAFDAAFLGDFPFRTASLALAADKAWKKEGRGFVNAGAGIRAAVPGPQLVLASSGSLDPLIALAKAPGPSPIPPRLRPLAEAEIAIWAPRPFSGLVASIIDEEMDIPAAGLLVAASPRKGGGYDATVAFLMDDADSARIFRPALRLAWYGIARGLLGEDADEALGLSFSLDGEVYWAAGARISSPALASALVKIREGCLAGT